MNAINMVKEKSLDREQKKQRLLELKKLLAVKQKKLEKCHRRAKAKEHVKKKVLELKAKPDSPILQKSPGCEDFQDTKEKVTRLAKVGRKASVSFNLNPLLDKEVGKGPSFANCSTLVSKNVLQDTTANIDDVNAVRRTPCKNMKKYVEDTETDKPVGINFQNDSCNIVPPTQHAMGSLSDQSSQESVICNSVDRKIGQRRAKKLKRLSLPLYPKLVYEIDKPVNLKEEQQLEGGVNTGSEIINNSLQHEQHRNCSDIAETIIKLPHTRGVKLKSDNPGNGVFKSKVVSEINNKNCESTDNHFQEGQEDLSSASLKAHGTASVVNSHSFGTRSSCSPSLHVASSLSMVSQIYEEKRNDTCATSRFTKTSGQSEKLCQRNVDKSGKTGPAQSKYGTSSNFLVTMPNKGEESEGKNYMKGSSKAANSSENLELSENSQSLQGELKCQSSGGNIVTESCLAGRVLDTTEVNIKHSTRKKKTRRSGASDLDFSFLDEASGGDMYSQIKSRKSRRISARSSKLDADTSILESQFSQEDSMNSSVSDNVDHGRHGLTIVDSSVKGPTLPKVAEGLSQVPYLIMQTGSNSPVTGKCSNIVSNTAMYNHVENNNRIGKETTSPMKEKNIVFPVVDSQQINKSGICEFELPDKEYGLLKNARAVVSGLLIDGNEDHMDKDGNEDHLDKDVSCAQVVGEQTDPLHGAEDITDSQSAVINSSSCILATVKECLRQTELRKDLQICDFTLPDQDFAGFKLSKIKQNSGSSSAGGVSCNKAHMFSIENNNSEGLHKSDLSNISSEQNTVTVDEADSMHTDSSIVFNSQVELTSEPEIKRKRGRGRQKKHVRGPVKPTGMADDSPNTLKKAISSPVNEHQNLSQGNRNVSGGGSDFTKENYCSKLVDNLLMSDFGEETIVAGAGALTDSLILRRGVVNCNQADSSEMFPSQCEIPSQRKQQTKQTGKGRGGRKGRGSSQRGDRRKDNSPYHSIQELDMAFVADEESQSLTQDNNSKHSKACFSLCGNISDHQSCNAALGQIEKDGVNDIVPDPGREKPKKEIFQVPDICRTGVEECSVTSAATGSSILPLDNHDNDLRSMHLIEKQPIEFEETVKVCREQIVSVAYGQCLIGGRDTDVMLCCTTNKALWWTRTSVQQWKEACVWRNPLRGPGLECVSLITVDKGICAVLVCHQKSDTRAVIVGFQGSRRTWDFELKKSLCSRILCCSVDVREFVIANSTRESSELSKFTLPQTGRYIMNEIACDSIDSPLVSLVAVKDLDMALLGASQCSFYICNFHPLVGVILKDSILMVLPRNNFYCLTWHNNKIARLWQCRIKERTRFSQGLLFVPALQLDTGLGCLCVVNPATGKSTVLNHHQRQAGLDVSIRKIHHSSNLCLWGKRLDMSYAVSNRKKSELHKFYEKLIKVVQAMISGDYVIGLTDCGTIGIWSLFSGELLGCRRQPEASTLALQQTASGDLLVVPSKHAKGTVDIYTVHPHQLK